jgi:protein-disulfide isomerase
MSRKHSWLMMLVVVVLLIAACGPEMATPTPSSQAVNTNPPPTPGSEVVDTNPSPTAAPAGETPTSKPLVSSELPLESDDWHVLGALDAPVSITEYSDFQ